MDNRNEDLIFDFMAAAEDTGKRLDALIKAIPREVRNTLSDEYRRSPWLENLSQAVERLNTTVKGMDAAAARIESATEQMVSKIKTVCFAACVAAVVMPFLALACSTVISRLL